MPAMERAPRACLLESFAGRHNENRALGLVDHFFGDVAEQPRGTSRPPTRADHDDSRVALPCIVRQRIGNAVGTVSVPPQVHDAGAIRSIFFGGHNACLDQVTSYEELGGPH